MAKYGLTPQGPNPKRLDVILEDMHSKMTERLGVNTRQNPQSLLNHTLTNVADEIAELWEFGVDVYHSQYTSSATGVSLDYAAQFGGSTREMAAKSYYSILCTGLDGTTIPAGTVIASDTNPATSLTATADATITRSAFNKATVILASPAATTALGVALNGNLYTITPDPKQSTSEALEALGTAITDKDFHVTVINDTIVIEAVDETSSNTLVLSENLTTASVGSIVTFETAEPGDIFIPNGVITKITKAVPGMESVVNVGSYVAGQLAESDVEFRKSYTNKIYNRSSAMLESIKSAILKNVQGVVSVAPYENCTNEVDSAGRWPHSIEVVVEGGDATEIAQQILNTKAGRHQYFRQRRNHPARRLRRRHRGALQPADVRQGLVQGWRHSESEHKSAYQLCRACQRADFGENERTGGGRERHPAEVQPSGVWHRLHRRMVVCNTE